MLLLFPVSKMESPKAMSAGTVTFGGSFTNEFVLYDKTNKHMKHNSINLVDESVLGSFIINTTILERDDYFASTLRKFIHPQMSVVIYWTRTMISNC